MCVSVFECVSVSVCMCVGVGVCVFGGNRGGPLTGSQIHIERSTSAFYQLHPDRVSASDCLRIGHWVFLKW